MVNAKSYDPRMEDMPVLISYPRSGSNWLNSIMELYFGRPRLRLGPTSFLKNRRVRNDFMWFHDHDIYSDLKLTHKNILYLYRNPCDVIFSLLMAEHDDVNQDLVDAQIKLIKAHHKKYLCGEYPSICYEKCKNNLPKEFKTILGFFKHNEALDIERLSFCADRANKPALIAKAVDKRYFNQSMMSAEYERRRRAFRDQYEACIYDRLEWE
jgi:hypothetical protein